ncbi:Transcription factor [Penicillium maclennaniae]|uniref:Transcription factor n=1 Tax=Penicillium maclennaniae TaxID=1343394 RepID=UPI0025409067|nr:Transcription factor [Penicillium maclennaniae]KAJ5666219.1 Transcription factor [Penicillium maclennaniae]
MAEDSQETGKVPGGHKSLFHETDQSADEKMSHHHDDSKQLPVLAPGPSRRFAPQTSAAVLRPKKNSTACFACKVAKRKCSGTCPCKACLAAGLQADCRFDPTRDLRRKVAVKRTMKELNDYKDLLETLLASIRSDPRDKLHELIELIRNNGSLRDIARAVGNPVTKFTDSETLSKASLATLSEFEDTKPHRRSESDQVPNSPEEEHPRGSPRATFHPYARVALETLCDIPLFRVPARPWTEVTDDSDFVSHLVSLYFTWDHPCAQYLDQKIFIDHMTRGDTSSQFCTPLLVNSLLAMACVRNSYFPSPQFILTPRQIYSDSPDAFFNLDDTFSRGQHFFQEAERLWNAQRGRQTLSNIQALLMMCSVLLSQGEVQQGWFLLRQAAQMGQDMGLLMLPRVVNPFKEEIRFVMPSISELSDDHVKREDDDEDSILHQMERIRTITAWGIFNLNLQMSVKMRRVTSLPPPISKVSMGGDADFEWTPYPRSNKITYAPKLARLPQLRQGMAELTDILAHVQELLHNQTLVSSIQDLSERAEVSYERLRQWLANWPKPPQIEKEPIPQILILRIKCHQAIINLLEMMIQRGSQGSLTTKLQQEWCQQVAEMAQCFRIHRQAYGLKYIPSQVVDAVQSSLRVLVHQLEIEEARHAFIEFCRFGIAMSRTFTPTANAIHAIQSLAQRGVVTLPPEAMAILDGFDFHGGQEA